MDVELVEANPKVEDVKDQQVLTRGPVVYCLEGIDNPDILEHTDLFSYKPGEYEIVAKDDLTYGIKIIKGEMLKAGKNQTQKFTAIPYFAWRNRGATKVRVWF